MTNQQLIDTILTKYKAAYPKARDIKKYTEYVNDMNRAELEFENMLIADWPTTNLLLNNIMKNTNYTVQFFHGIEGVWKGTGGRIFTDREAARAFMTAQSEMCGGAVAFRIEEVA